MNWSDVGELAKEIDAIQKELEPLKAFHDEYIEKPARLSELKSRFAESAKGYVPQVVTKNPNGKTYRAGEKTLLATECCRALGRQRQTFTATDVKNMMNQQGHEVSDPVVYGVLHTLEDTHELVRVGAREYRLCSE